MLRSVLAVLAGLVVILITSFGIEAVANPLLVKTLGLPNEAALPHNMGVWLVTFSYTFVCVMGGGWVTARLAPKLPERHALALGVIQSLLTIPAMLAFPAQAPTWGWIVSMIMVIPAAWFGGVLYARGRR